MGVEGIKISMPEVLNTADSIRNINNALDINLQDIKREMDSLASTWQSDSSNTVREKFNALAPRFEEYKQVIESYAKFLNATVTNYESVEAAINSNASSFK